MNKKYHVKEFLLEFFGELLIYIVFFLIGLFMLWILPFEKIKNLDFELVMFLGVIVFLPIILLIILFVGYLVYFIKLGNKMKDFKKIYKKYKKQYNILLLSYSKQINDRNVDYPMLVGKNSNGKFKIIDENKKYSFIIEYNDNSIFENKTLYPKDLIEIENLINEFMNNR